MRNYECLFIVKPDFDGDGISNVIEKVTGYVKEAKAEVAKIQHWGKRRLAYTIDKQQYGDYVLMYFNGEAPEVAELQHNMELDSTVLAYLTVRLDEMPDFEKLTIPEDDGEDDRRFRSRGRDNVHRDRREHADEETEDKADVEEEDDSDESEADNEEEAESEVDDNEDEAEPESDTEAAAEKDEEPEAETAVSEDTDESPDESAEVESDSDENDQPEPESDEKKDDE